MNGLQRGQRVWALIEHEPHAVIVLDKSPEGWWVAFEDLVIDGRQRVEQRPARHLYPSRLVALGRM